MLRQILCLVGVLLAVQCSAKPQFCGKYDCPQYTVQTKTDDYELRCYQSYKWVRTTLSGFFFRSSKAFMRLFRYIEGENERKMKINMTVPVLMEKEHGLISTKENMSFFIPFVHQANPPRPTSSDVYLKNVPSFCVYVRTFSGLMEWGEWWHYWKLLNALNKDGKSYKKDFYITAGYNSPMTWPWERHNEIWFVKE